MVTFLGVDLSRFRGVFFSFWVWFCLVFGVVGGGWVGWGWERGGWVGWGGIFAWEGGGGGEGASVGEGEERGSLCGCLERGKGRGGRGRREEGFCVVWERRGGEGERGERGIGGSLCVWWVGWGGIGVGVGWGGVGWVGVVGRGGGEEGGEGVLCVWRGGGRGRWGGKGRVEGLCEWVGGWWFWRAT